MRPRSMPPRSSLTLSISLNNAWRLPSGESGSTPPQAANIAQTQVSRRNFFRAIDTTSGVTGGRQYRGSTGLGQATSCHNDCISHAPVSRRSAGPSRKTGLATSGRDHEQGDDQAHPDEPHQRAQRSPASQIADEVQQAADDERYGQLIEQRLPGATGLMGNDHRGSERRSHL